MRRQLLALLGLALLLTACDLTAEGGIQTLTALAPRPTPTVVANTAEVAPGIVLKIPPTPTATPEWTPSPSGVIIGRHREITTLYFSQPALADNLFKGKRIRFEGVADPVDFTGVLPPSLSFPSILFRGGGAYGVYCNIPDLTSFKGLQTTAFDQLTVDGTILGMQKSMLYLEDCTFVLKVRPSWLS